MFETPKVIVGEILIEVLVLLTFLKSRFQLRINPFTGAVALLFLLSLIDLIFLRTDTTLFGNPFRLQGVFLLWHLLVLAVVSSAISLPKRAYFLVTFSLDSKEQ